MQFIDLKAQQSKIRKNIEKRLRRVLDHGQYILGPEVFELEEILANDVGTKYCISCSSGTDALLILLMAKNIGPGDAVLTTPFTFIATAEVITLLGATPVFVDIYEKTFNINPSKIEDAILFSKEKGLIPKAIIPVDLFGLPARYRIINKIAKKYGLFIIEDAAQAYGGKIRNQKAGSFGDAATTSFFPAKPLGCYGDGGAIFTNFENIANAARSIVNHGAGSDKYNNIRTGINGRLDTIQAAILLEKFTIFSKELNYRNKVANRYTINISKLYNVPYIPIDYQSSWAQYSILIPDHSIRKNVIKRLKDKNIPVMIYYPLSLHMQKVFKSLGYKKGDFPVSEKTSRKILALPMHPYLNPEKQDFIINELNCAIY